MYTIINQETKELLAKVDTLADFLDFSRNYYEYNGINLLIIGYNSNTIEVQLLKEYITHTLLYEAI